MKPHPLYQKVLREHHLFTALNEQQLAELLDDSRLVNLEKGEAVFKQGDPCHYFCFVISGSVKIFRTTPDGQEKVLEVVGDRSTFAEAMMFMGRDAYVASAQAVQPTQLLMLSNDVYRQLVRRSEDTAMALLAALSMRLHRRVGEIEMLSLKNATHRVIRYLLSQGLRQCGDCEELSFELPMAKRLVAGHLSIQPETFSRILHNLGNEGLIRVNGRMICILDRERLEEFD